MDDSNNQQPAGKPTNRQTERFDRAKTHVSRERLERGYGGIVDHLWYGMHDIWWAGTHPIKAFARFGGQMSMIVTVVSVGGAVGYLMFSEPGSAVDLRRPGSLLEVLGDNTVRPVFRFSRGAAGDVIQQTNDNFNGDDYQRD